jgi:LPS export ABC transporter permease LptG
LADIVTFMAGAFLLWTAERRPFDLSSLAVIARPFNTAWKRFLSMSSGATRVQSAFQRAQGRRRVLSASFPMILDDYVLRDFVINFVMITSTFLVLVLVFTLFELLGDILRNQISPLVVGEYLLNVSPYFLYNIAPVVMLLAVLITLGLMQHSNELTAIKATGISIYRIVMPLLFASAIIATSLFFFDQFYLPYANKRQDALRNLIKGKPAQTYLSPDRKWILGQHSSIFYYQFFDSDRDQFGNLTVFQFDPASLQMTRRVYADRAHWEPNLQRWVCTQGWERVLRVSAIEYYRNFDVSTFAAINEAPSYFKKEVKQSSEMNYEELRRYIKDLQQSGFDVVRLKVQLQKKLAFPIIVLVMAVLAVPFSLSAGRRGTIASVAVAVGVGVVYITVSNLFEAMGNVSQLPPTLAAWSPDLIFALVGGYLILKVPT